MIVIIFIDIILYDIYILLQQIIININMYII
jgi:hypothetical protein